MSKKRDEKHDIFISYRRDGGEDLSWRLAEALQKKGYDAFRDADLKAGPFDKQLYFVIDSCKDFLLVLTPNTLDRCINDGDWVRLEIERAKEDNKNIIPIKHKKFSMPDELPESLEFLKKQQTIELYPRLLPGEMHTKSAFLCHECCETVMLKLMECTPSGPDIPEAREDSAPVPLVLCHPDADTDGTHTVRP